jgi:L-alanine-DL-glutamate epimerase-like enolase superfamily enzyme
MKMTAAPHPAFGHPLPPGEGHDLEGLRFIRQRTPIEIAAGEYGYELQYFAEMIGSVDVLQADATRCCGITGFIKTSALCEARSIALSAHCAPSLHAALGCALLPLRHIEYFFRSRADRRDVVRRIRRAAQRRVACRCIAAGDWGGIENE